jgi:hypothetical protein
VRLAEHVEGLLEIAVVGQRAAVGGEQLAVAGIGDGGLLENRDRLRALSFALARYRSARVSVSRRKSPSARTSALLLIEPVMSGNPELWQPPSPRTATEVHARSNAARDG